ncbi:MAG: cyclopropane fatty-acyl-phospholipid synthase-like methyltransferase [Candidatus Azotimanducaceae bacterium]|jgi:cyclopropane fatty-acyl-phospholipid synthase-like methyltransferase
MNRPYSESCEQNKDVILSTIQPYLFDGARVLEIGSGTGQHAVYFASLNPKIVWQPSDRAEYLQGIEAWINSASHPNLKAAIELDVLKLWPSESYDILFSANSFHIMDNKAVEICLEKATNCLTKNGFFIIYGPFNYNKQYTSSSNQRFDGWLKANDPDSGIKDIEWVCDIAHQAGLRLIDDIEMPANNRILIWKLETFTE